MKIINVTVSKGRKIPGVGRDKYGNREYFVSATAELEITDDIPSDIVELFKGCERAITKEIRNDRYGDVLLPPVEEPSTELHEEFGAPTTDEEEDEEDIITFRMLPLEEAMPVFKEAWKNAQKDIQRDGTISFAALWAPMHESIKEGYFDEVILTLKNKSIIECPRPNYYRWVAETKDRYLAEASD